ncbi:MAG: phosphate acetyltransferase [Dermatophilaceae bacterium]
MATSVYLASAEGRSGKSMIAIGLLDELSKGVQRVGVFRPVIRGDHPEQDHVLALALSRLGGDADPARHYGVTYDEVHHDPDQAMARIVDKFHAVAADRQAVLVIGSDHTDVGATTEFSFNARVAANLGAPMLLVLSAFLRTPDQIGNSAELAVEEAHAHHARVIGLIANGVRPKWRAETLSLLESVAGQLPVYAVPDHPPLRAPTVADLAQATGATLRFGDPSLLERETTKVVVGAMTLPHVLERIEDGCVVVTPGDRADNILGLLLAHHSQTFPPLAGIVVNGGIPIADSVVRLVEGLRLTVPVLEVGSETAETTNRMTQVVGRLTAATTRKIQTALALVEEYVDAAALLERLDMSTTQAVTPLMFEHTLIDRARRADRPIVLPEGEEDRILAAADQLLRRKVARITLLGIPGFIHAKAQRLQLDIGGATVLDPSDEPLRERFASEYYALRKDKGATLESARDTIVDPSYFGTMMVLDGLADGMVSGSINTTAHTIRPALQVIRTQPGVSVVSSVFFMCLPDRVLAYGDCAVNPDPTAEQLADIAISSAATAAQFGIEPRVAMLSYSTGLSGTGADVEKVREATALVRARAPQLSVEGPIQYDAAVDAAVARTKLSGSSVAGRATVLIFPDLNTGNNTYKAVQRSAGALAIGPVLQGLRKPVNDLSRGALVADIVNTVAITAIQAGAR